MLSFLEQIKTFHASWTIADTIPIFLFGICVGLMPRLSAFLLDKLPDFCKWGSNTTFGVRRWNGWSIICFLILINLHLLGYATDIRLKAEPKFEFVAVPYNSPNIEPIENPPEGEKVWNRASIQWAIGIKNISSQTIDNVQVKVIKIKEQEVWRLGDQTLFKPPHTHEYFNRILAPKEDLNTIKTSVNPGDTKLFTIATVTYSALEEENGTFNLFGNQRKMSGLYEVLVQGSGQDAPTIFSTYKISGGPEGLNIEYARDLKNVTW